MINEIFKEIEPNLNEFERSLLVESLKSIEHTQHLIRFNSFAFSFRELTRHIFKRLAPDEEVLNCLWYKNETENDKGITRMQRIMYSIKGGLDDDFIKDELEYDIGDVPKRLKKTIDTLSKYTHIEEATFNLDEESGKIMVLESLIALRNLFDTIKIIRDEITSAYEHRLHEAVSFALTSDVLEEIDVLATHYWVEGCSVENIEVESITAKIISIIVDGEVEIEHQYGSDGDFARGDGARFEDSYPFKVNVLLDVRFPLDVDIEASDFEIDNSKFYE